MSTTRREFIKTVGAAIASSQISPQAAALNVTDAAPAPFSPSPAGTRRKVIYDQDNSGPFGTDILGTLMMLQADNIDLLGITLVTGDAWMKQEMAFTLRLLEMMGRTEIPVYLGAEFPMLNTKEEWLLRQQLYGGHRLDPWMGAFNRTNGGPDEIKPLPPPYDRFANIRAQPDHAARFIIKTVRENPGQVTIYAGGPLTNLALAIALAPDIVPLVPEVVFMGTGFHAFTNAFNVFFDPEAARKVLRAAWPKFSIVTVDIAEEIHEGSEISPGRRMIEEIAARADSPISDLFKKYAVEPLRNDPNMQLLPHGGRNDRRTDHPARCFYQVRPDVCGHLLQPRPALRRFDVLAGELAGTPGRRKGRSERGRPASLCRRTAVLSGAAALGRIGQCAA